MTLLVIDLGSSSARALLFDDAAQLIEASIESRPHDFSTDSAGRATADALELRRLVEDCLDSVLRQPAARDIRAVGMTSFVGNWLGLDENGAPCTPLMTYADTRSRSEIPQLLAKLDGDAAPLHQATGCFLHPAYLPAQYAYLRRAEPAAAAKIQRISDIGGYLYQQFFGRELPLSYSVASWTGLLDRARRVWHAQYARLLAGPDLLEKLPRLADYDAAAVGLAPAYAKRWPALRACPFYLALGDGAAANVGSGAVDAQHIALTIGTTSALRVVKAVERVPPGLWSYVVCADMPLVGGATSEGGNVYQWAVEELALDKSALEAQLARRPPDAHGLTVLPLLAGERSPGWQPDASGTIHGLRRHTSRLDILQAQLEAVALRLSLIFDLLKTEEMGEATLMAGGGALQASPAWARMLADAFDRPIQLLAEREVTARGVALMLRRSLTGLAPHTAPPRIQRVIEPEPARVRRLRAARVRQVALYRRLYS